MSTVWLDNNRKVEVSSEVAECIGELRIKLDKYKRLNKQEDISLMLGKNARLKNNKVTNKWL